MVLERMGDFDQGWNGYGRKNAEAGKADEFDIHWMNDAASKAYKAGYNAGWTYAAMEEANEILAGAKGGGGGGGGGGSGSGGDGGCAAGVKDSIGSGAARHAGRARLGARRRHHRAPHRRPHGGLDHLRGRSGGTDPSSTTGPSRPLVLEHGFLQLATERLSHNLSFITERERDVHCRDLPSGSGIQLLRIESTERRDVCYIS